VRTTAGSCIGRLDLIDHRRIPQHVEPSVIDIAEMRRRLGADDELIRDIAATFLVALAPLRAQLAEAAAREDLTALRRGAHALRGALLDVAALHAADLAWQIEVADGGAADQLARLSGLLDAVAAAATRLAAT
jgi:HPt (histidine-containing phosphotransfer) domain-containing protein